MPNVTTQIAPTSNPQQSGTKQYTPPNWSVKKTLYSIVTNDNTTTSPITTDANGNLVMQTNVSGSTLTMFVFDGLRLADHDQSCIPTQHPLQAGYNITDHAVLQPARLVLEVVMSDAIAAYSSGMWTGNPSKSISAFQQMQLLMQNRTLLTLNTRLQTYTNMLLVNVKSQDNQRYYSGQLSMVLTFQQIFIGTIAVQSSSARSQTTGSTQQGQVNGQTPDSTTLDQHTVTTGEPSGPTADQGVIVGPNNFHIEGAGTISSNNVAQAAQ
jgi:Dit-like tail protein